MHGFGARCGGLREQTSVIESTREAILPNAEFLKRSIGERFEIVTGSRHSELITSSSFETIRSCM